MNRALKLTVLVREGALLTNVAQALADATRSGMAMVLVDCSDPTDEEAAAMAQQIRARSGRVIVASVAEDLEHGLVATYEGLPSEDQFETWGLQELLPDEDEDEAEAETETEQDEESTTDPATIEQGSSEDAPKGDAIVDQLAASTASAANFTASAATDATTSETSAPE